MRKSWTVTLAAGAAAGALLLSGCMDKATEPYKDAGVKVRNNDAARVVGTMPDGFSNWAAKCDGPNMVYTIFHQDAKYGAIAVVPNDPRCVSSK